MQVWTCELPSSDIDLLDISPYTTPPCEFSVFAPWIGIHERWRALQRRIDTASPVTNPSEWIRLHKQRDALWAEYKPAYIRAMRESYRDHRHTWLELLQRARVVLGCPCRMPAYCHRTLLADILAKMGAEYLGELEVR